MHLLKVKKGSIQTNENVYRGVRITSIVLHCNASWIAVYTVSTLNINLLSCHVNHEGKDANGMYSPTESNMVKYNSL